MATVDREGIERVLHTLEELKIDLEEIINILRANEKRRESQLMSSLLLSTIASDLEVRSNGQGQNSRCDWRKTRPSQGEGHVERILDEAPSQIMRLQAARSAAKPRITQQMCEPPIVMEKPRYPPIDC
jgi:hypothetical protein